MTYPTIKTTEDLRSFMSTLDSKGSITDDELVWFVCISNAKIIFDTHSMKDVAAMLREGVQPTNTLEDVQDFLDTFYEDTDDDRALLMNLILIREVVGFMGADDKVDIEALDNLIIELEV